MVQYVKSSRASSPNTKIQDVPNVPTIGTPVQNGSVVDVPFTPATLGGKAAVYRAVSNPGGIEGISYGSSPISVSGLASNTSYTFTVRGETAAGATTGYTTASSSVTPVFSAMELISTAVLTTATQFIFFSNIPQEYKHLQLRMTMKTDSTSPDCYIAFNGEATATNHSYHHLTSNGSSVFSSAAPSAWIVIGIPELSTSTANAFANLIVDIPDYSSTTKFKTARSFSGGTSINQIKIMSGSWRNTAAITEIRLNSGGGSAIAGSRFSLYGIRG